MSQEKRLAHLRLRAGILHLIRDWFHRHDFVEVETPIRIPCPALELHIDAIASESAYLRTSPELHMKRLLAEGLENIYQMGPCFRAGESGPRHHPEYCMLEWYRTHADYRGILDDTVSLVRHLCPSGSLDYQGQSIDVEAPWHILRVSQAFQDHAGWNPAADFDANRFDLDLVEKVEPGLPKDRPVVLIDYPAPVAALSRLKPEDSRLAERWELYIAGVELANAYSELTDPVEQRARFEACAKQREYMEKPVYPLDEKFLHSIERMPPCGGIALGVDRLVMLLADVTDLALVTTFQESAPL